MVDKICFFIRKNVILIISVLIIGLIFVIFMFLGNIKARKDPFSLNKIYSIYPKEVREIYSNMVSIDCNGDLKFNIEQNSGVVDIKDLDKHNLLDYMFNYMEKNNILDVTSSIKTLENIENKLFYEKLNLSNEIHNYNYNGYVYNVNGNKIVKKKSNCVDNHIKHVSLLYGYSYNEEKLSIDINVGYIKDDKIYDYNNKYLGDYSDDITEIYSLLTNTSYYRITYMKVDGYYKLKNIEWNERK